MLAVLSSIKKRRPRAGHFYSVDGHNGGDLQLSISDVVQINLIGLHCKNTRTLKKHAADVAKYDVTGTRHCGVVVNIEFKRVRSKIKMNAKSLK